MIIMEIFGPILISTLAGLSTVIGSFIVFFKIKRIGEFISFCLSFSLSVMISISVIELIPNSSIEITNHFGYILGFVILLVVFFLGSFTINLINNKIKNISKSNSLYRVGILSMLALMIHNFPEGIATFMASYKDIYLGIHLGFAIMMHNIPEGISIAIPIYYSTGNKSRAIKNTLLSGFAEPLGAILTYILFKNFINNITISIVLIFVAGIMITLSINEMLPEVLRYNKNKYVILGLISGVVIVIFNHFIL